MSESQPGPVPSRQPAPQEAVPQRPEAAQAQPDGGEQVPAGTQVSPAADAPRISQDVEGKPVNILLDPETGAPLADQ